ncbi:MAG TPA: prepilin-type N-terminal cleavage/methylation domain-containing protein [Longimicrobiales bacterium]
MFVPAAGSCSRRDGFTLFELVVALAITGLVATAAVDAVRAASDAWARVKDTRSRTLAAANARLLLGDWIRAAATLEDGPAVVGVSRSLGGLPRDELLLRIGDGGALYPGPHRVHLWIGRAHAAGEPGLYAALMPLGDAAAAADTVLVASGANGMALRFLARVDGRDQWLHAWAEEEPPRAIELRLIAAPYDVLADRARLAPLFRRPIVAAIARRGAP